MNRNKRKRSLKKELEEEIEEIGQIGIEMKIQTTIKSIFITIQIVYWKKRST